MGVWNCSEIQMAFFSYFYCNSDFFFHVIHKSIVLQLIWGGVWWCSLVFNCMEIVRMNNQSLWSFCSVNKMHEYIPPHLLLLINTVEMWWFLRHCFFITHLKVYRQESQLLDSNFLVLKRAPCKSVFFILYIWSSHKCEKAPQKPEQIANIHVDVGWDSLPQIVDKQLLGKWMSLLKFHVPFDLCRTLFFTYVALFML